MSGNMYQWIDLKHSYLEGECPHRCAYCYVPSQRWVADKHTGSLRFNESRLNHRFPTRKSKVIFVEHMSDLFAANVPDEWIDRVVAHTKQYPSNTYVFQSKNPARFHTVSHYPANVLFGCTIESNRYYPEISKAPPPIDRAIAMAALKGRRFVTIEPILDLDIGVMIDWLLTIQPDTVYIGADSKNHHLPEPSGVKVLTLIAELRANHIETVEKSNLDRITGGKR